MIQHIHGTPRQPGRLWYLALVITLGASLLHLVWHPSSVVTATDNVTLRGTQWRVQVTNPQGETSEDTYRFVSNTTFSATGFPDCTPVAYTERPVNGHLRFTTRALCQRERGEAAAFTFRGTLFLDTGDLRGRVRDATGMESIFVATRSNLDRAARLALRASYGQRGAQRFYQYATKIAALLSDAVTTTFPGSALPPSTVNICVPTVTYPGGQPSDTDHDFIPNEATIDFGPTGCDYNDDGNADFRYAFRLLDTGAGIRLEFTVNAIHFQVTLASSEAPRTFTLGGALALTTRTEPDGTGHVVITQNQTYEQFSLQNGTSTPNVLDGTLQLTEQTVEEAGTTLHRITSTGELTLVVGAVTRTVALTITTDAQDNNANGALDLYDVSLDSIITEENSSVHLSTGNTVLTGNAETCDWPLDGVLSMEQGRETIRVYFGDPADCALARVTVNGIPIGVFNFANGEFE